jgi:hypothetical protein
LGDQVVKGDRCFRSWLLCFITHKELEEVLCLKSGATDDYPQLWPPFHNLLEHSEKYICTQRSFMGFIDHDDRVT